MTQAFPIQWPKGPSRTSRRKDSAFKVQPTRAFDELMDELQRFKAKGVVVSSNIPTRQDGTPYRDGLRELLDDPGVAVYFTKGARLVCLPCDTYRRPWENIRAIYIAVKGFRDMDRHGAHQILDQAFQGFTALPPPDADFAEPNGAYRSWHEVLGVDVNCTLQEAERAWKNLARGTPENERYDINAAIEAARAAR